MTDQPQMYFGDARMLPRFWNKVQPEYNSGCWLWTGSSRKNGYGLLAHDGRTQTAHRVIYATLHNLKLVAEDFIMHICDNRMCVNPEHLMAGNARANFDDMWNKGRYKGFCAKNAAATHCIRGHAFTAESSLYRKGRRVCIPCRDAYWKQRTIMLAARRKAARLAAQPEKGEAL